MSIAAAPHLLPYTPEGLRNFLIIYALILPSVIAVMHLNNNESLLITIVQSVSAFLLCRFSGWPRLFQPSQGFIIGSHGHCHCSADRHYNTHGFTFLLSLLGELAPFSGVLSPINCEPFQCSTTENRYWLSLFDVQSKFLPALDHEHQHILNSVCQHLSIASAFPCRLVPFGCSDTWNAVKKEEKNKTGMAVNQSWAMFWALRIKLAFSTFQCKGQSSRT